MIVISKPYIVETDTTAKLCCPVTVENISKTIYYEVSAEYSKYLVDEVCDAVFVAALPFALTKGLDISIDGPISEKLYYNIKTQYLPFITEQVEIYKKVNVINECHEWDSVAKGTGVGMGISLGVDSLYTYLDLINRDDDAPKLTHLTYFNVGSHRDEFYSEINGSDKANELFQERKVRAEEFAKDERIDFLSVNSNIGEIFNMEHVLSHTYRSASAVLALQKLFRHYYYSSGYSSEDGIRFENEPAHWELFLLPYLSTENTQFYSWGGVKTRLEKVEQISAFPICNEYINVCFQSSNNCSTCEKCRRTMLELWVLQLDSKFMDAFDWKYFYSNIDEYILYLLHKAKVEKNSDYIEVVGMAEKKKMIPLKIKLHFMLRSMKERLINSLSS